MSLAEQVAENLMADTVTNALHNAFFSNQSAGMVIEKRVPRPPIDYLQTSMTKYTLVQAAVEALVRCDSENLERALRGARPNHFSLWRRTSLLHLAAANRPSMIEFLVRKGFVVNATNENDTTPLHIACEEGCNEACRILVSLGANPNAQDMFGNTPMMRGVRAGRPDAISLMTSLGGNPHIMTFSGMTPLEVERQMNKGTIESCCHSLTYGLSFIPRHLTASCQRRQMERHPDYFFQSVEEAAISANGTREGASMPVAVPVEVVSEEALPLKEKAGLLVDEHEEGRAELEAEPVPLRTASALRARGLTCPPLGGLFLLILILGWSVYSIMCAVHYENAESSVTDESSCPDDSSVLVGVFVFLYVAQMIEAICYGRKYLTATINSDRAFISSHSKMADKVKLRMDIACYHWVTRRYTTTDKNGKTHTTTTTEKRYTHRASQHYIFDEQWVAPVSFQPFTGVSLVSFVGEYEFADSITADLFEKDKAIFIALNNRDVHYEYNTVDETPIPNGFVALDGLQSVRLINFPAYVIISIFMLSVPYRIWLKSISSKQKIPIRRVVWKGWQIANA